MAPSATETATATAIPVSAGKANLSSSKPWVKSTGVLDQYEHIEVTPIIGREYPHAKLAQWLQSSNSDDLIRELALTSKLLR